MRCKMKRFNIMAAKKYPKQDGIQGIKWVKLGSVVQADDGKFFGDLDSIPAGAWFDGSIHLFEAEQQNQQKTSAHNNSYSQSNGYNPNNYGNYRG
ncbi:MAG: hypothetical protein KA157_09410 [Aliarcobacter sp.]|nr:hypothetical protein [Aliarcobacter sp.]